MAKFDLKFLSFDDDNWTISVKEANQQIEISTESLDDLLTICLDKSTAIKFAKTLRTEINKIKDEDNG